MDRNSKRSKDNAEINLTQEYFSQAAQCYVYFVKTASNTEEFFKDFRLFKEHHDRERDAVVEMMDEDQCLQLQKHVLQKRKTIFVFEEFDSDLKSFEHICSMQTIYVIGSKLMMTGLERHLVVPYGFHHIYNFFMRGLHVCFASFVPERKAYYRKLVEFMGGEHADPLLKRTTHIVTEDVFAKKYNHGMELKMRILHPSWVEESWMASLDETSTIRPNDEEFCNKHKLKVFHRLVVTSTGLTTEEKKSVQSLVEQNGGTYSPTFKTLTASVLIMKQKDIDSKKYIAAQQHDIHCLDPSWIQNSVKSGYTQRPEKYRIVKQPKSSTPTKENTSALRNFCLDNTAISEIHDHTTQNVSFDETKQRASMAPTTSSRTASSSTRSSAVSGKATATSFKKPAVPTAASTRRTTMDVVKIPSPPPRFECSDDQTSDESFIQILVNKVVSIYGFQNDMDSMTCIKECEKLGASLVDLSYSKTVDYVIGPSQYMLKEEPKLKYKYFVNDIWLEDSIEDGRCIDPPNFYHHALFKRATEHQVLKGEVFACSNYGERERPFVKSIVQILGGTLKDVFSNSDPILICELTNGRKYEAAVLWNKTVLNADWLINCFLQKTRVDETPYLLGPTKPSARNMVEMDIPSSQEVAFERSIYRASPSTPDAPSTPKTPAPAAAAATGTPVYCLDKVCEDLPTPSRELTKKILIESRRLRNENISPRKQKLTDLLKTPGGGGGADNFLYDVSSPAPMVPEFMRPPDENYALFKDSSPYTQWWYKQKWEVHEKLYGQPASSEKQRVIEWQMVESPENPRDQWRDFWRRRLPEFASPATPAAGRICPEVSAPATPVAGRKSPEVPAIDSQFTMADEASKFLNFGDTERITPRKSPRADEDDISSLEELLKEAKKDSEKKARVSERLEYEAQQQSARKSFQPTSSSENRMLVDQHTDIDEVNWSSSQANYPRRTETENESYRVRSMAFRKLTDVDYDNNEEDDVDMERGLRASTSSKIDFSLNAEENNASDSKEENVPMIFALSCGNASVEIKNELHEKIKKLGTEFVDTDFNHLIIGKLVRSSKFFIALASGMKILHSDYLDECLRQKKFVDTDEYELGNPQFKCIFNGGKDDVLLNGPYRCRMLIERNFDRFSGGLFTGQNFIVYASPDRLRNIMDVITCGGGNIIDAPFSTSILKRENIRFCLADNAKMIGEKEYAMLKACKIEVRSTKYIYDYLLTETIV